MRVLAIDTSLSDISAAISLEPGHIVSRTVQHHRDALQKLTGLVSAVLEEAGIRPDEVQIVGCTQGPGSFTGLRVGIAAAKAFADTVGVPMAGVSTLQMLALRGAAPGQGVASLIECCAGELYCGLYRAELSGFVTALEADAVRRTEDVPAWLEDMGEKHSVPISLAGPGLEGCSSLLNNWPQRPDSVSIEILDVVRTSRCMAEEGYLCSALEFAPEYLRLSHAEIRAAEV